MNVKNYTFKAIILSIAFWLFDSGMHRYLYSEENFEFIPSDVDELWMRSLIVLLIIAIGMYADNHIKTLHEKEREKEREKHAIFNATLKSTNHILNNLLNQMQYFKIKSDDSNFLDDEDNALYEQSIREGEALVKKLSAVEELTVENILASVHFQDQVQKTNVSN